MNTINNFDCNSKGLPVSIDAYYDNDRGRWYFDDNFERIDERKDDLWFFKDWGNVSIDKQEVVSIYVYDMLDELVADEERRNYLIDYYGFDEYESGDMIDLPQVLQFILEEIDDHKRAFSLIFTDTDLDFTEVTGYSQGDYALVIYSKKDWSDDFNFNTYFRNLIFASPITCTIEFDEGSGVHVMDIDENLNNHYEWIKDDIVKIIKSQTDISDAMKQEIIRLLPESIDYRD